MRLQNVLHDISREIGRCYFVSCFDLQSGLPLESVSDRNQYDAEAISAAFVSILNIIMVSQQKARNETVRSLLKGFKELILETSQSSFFILIPDNKTKLAMVVGAPVDVKIGFVRLCIKRNLQSLISALAEIM